ncbi:MAG: hypothetical protein J0L67_00155 [Cytophagales bacterium]|nr:hypothetical protein [Cytophagales bacterium]
MEGQTTELLKLTIPGVVAIIGNLIVYVIVKRRIDNSIERHKISYSGIFKEKIEVHKQILKGLFELKLKIQQYQYLGNQDLAKEIFLDVNKFISFYQMNQPFIKPKILDGLKTLTKELQICFEDFYRHNYLVTKEGIDPKIIHDTLNKFFESGNKFKKNEPFNQIEELIISEMKSDLRIIE